MEELTFNQEEKYFFGSFLKKLRAKQGISLKDLASGVCSLGHITKIENGTRTTKKILRDRLLDRLAYHPERQESFLYASEYDDWKCRQHILYVIKCRDYDLGLRLVDEYACRLKEEDNLELQFCHDMKAMIYKLSCKCERLIKSELENAIKCTCNTLDSQKVSALILAPNEINLWLEYSLFMPVEDRKAITCALFHIMNRLGYDDAFGNCIYPKALLFYASNLILDNSVTKKDIVNLIYKCNGLLKVYKRRKYLINILEIQNLCIKLVQKLLNDYTLNTRYRDRWEVYLKEIKHSQSAIMRTEDIIGISLKTDDWTHLYLQQGVYCIGDVIRKRRCMLGMSQQSLCEGICGKRTLIRIEHNKSELSNVYVRDIFCRLYLSKEVQRISLETDDILNYYSEEKIIMLISKGKYLEAKSEINKVIKNLDMENPLNKQYITFLECHVKYGLKEITSIEEYVSTMIESLNYTFHFDGKLKNDLFLTRQEYQDIYSIAYSTEDTENKYCKLAEHIYKLLDKTYDDQPETLDLRIYEMYSHFAALYYRRKEDYDKSIQVCLKTIKEMFINKRAWALYPIIVQMEKTIENHTNTDLDFKNNVAIIGNYVRSYLATWN